MSVDHDGRERGAPVLSPVRSDEPDPRQSLQHVLVTSDTKHENVSPQVLSPPSNSHSPGKQPASWTQEGGKEHGEDERSVQNDSYTRAADINPSHTMTVAHSRRNANGTIGSVYSGNKIRHLKKDDGIPLWRKDIQFSFLRAVFEDQTRVFTRVDDGTPGHTFSEIYIAAMARSSKTSKILREKLLTEHEAATNMAMVCLLVNVGRMNTTLNFFPEMRAQLRTYHSIPCLQAHQDPNAYKQLQDAPRLKSILKGACEDLDQPTTIERIQALPVPRTNPVNLIFVLSQYAPKVSETHFVQPRDFFDLVIRATLSSRSRAQAFLWLIWWYLESDFSQHDAENNPFGAGQLGEGPGTMPLKVPAFDHLTEEQANAENVDTEEEKAYGEMKRLERKRILEEDETVGPPMKKMMKMPGLENTFEERSVSSPGPGALPSDVDRTRSPSPNPAGVPVPKPAARQARFTAFRNENSPSSTRADFEKQVPITRVILKTRPDNMAESSSPAPPGSAHPVLHPTPINGIHHRRPRPETSHQKAVNINRRMRIDNILHKKLVSEHRRVRRKKRDESSTAAYTAMRRILDLPDDYDTEEEGSWGPGGLVPNPGTEEEDFGGEALKHKKVVDRAVRRLARDGQPRPLANLTQSLQARRRNKARSYNNDNDDGIGTGAACERRVAATTTSSYRRPPTTKRGKNGTSTRTGRGTGKSSNSLLPPLDARSRRSRSLGAAHESQEDGLDDLDLDLLGESRHERVEGEGDGEEGDEESGIEDTEEGEGDDDTEEDITGIGGVGEV